MSGGLHSLATIIKRLEAATSRLEDLAVAQGAPVPQQRDTQSSTPNASPPAPPPPPPPPPPPVAPAPTEVPKSVLVYDEIIIDTHLKPFVALTKTLGSPILEGQIENVEKAFHDLRTIILTAAAVKKPDQNGIAEVFTAIRGRVMAIMGVPESNRKERQWFNHLSVISEGTPSVGWIEVEPKPGPHVKQMKESAEFYGLKILKEFKDKDQKQIEWVKAWMNLLEEQRKYVMEFHTTGLAWNPKGVDLSSFSPTAQAAPPPPPPPPPAPAGGTVAPAGGAAAVFAELNRGTEVTKGLRKVDPSQMTHKNPALRAGSTVPSEPTSATSTPQKRPTKPAKPQALMGKKPSKFALEGNKWIIEHYENDTSLAVADTQISHIVNVYNCKNCTIQVKGKVNAVNLLNCTKVSILVESVISGVSVTNSPSFALQITGSAATVQIDKTDSGQIFLSKECAGVEIFTAKCSSINVNIPVDGEEEGIYRERAIPEMLRTTVSDGKLVTAIVEHTG